MKPRSSAEGVVVAAVHARTAAAAAGLRPGDRVLAINGHALRDAIDFRFHGGDERLALSVERDGARHALRLARRPGADLGVELEAPRADEIATCANKCVFCFIHQLPKGMRKSLYVKDDDFRLSFLHGNYITLTDLEEAELTRIVEQRLSPLYVSVHATDPALRWELLGRPRASAEILPRLERLAKAGIRMHAQVVLCPGLNDGAHLERTVRELAPLHPHVATTAVVPVGLTRHRERGGRGEPLLRRHRVGRGPPHRGGHRAASGHAADPRRGRRRPGRRAARPRRRLPGRHEPGGPGRGRRRPGSRRRARAEGAALSGMLRPVIAIVGRPNVGKSTLFNRLVGRRQALVRDTPGVTRDRLYGQVQFERWQATVIDTGGFDPGSTEPLVEGVRRQVLAAVEDADLIAFVVDAREGATALDQEIARLLRKTNKPVVLVASKVDDRGQEPALADLYRLGFGEPLGVSGEHGRGVAEMLEVLRERAPSPTAPPGGKRPVAIAVIGRPNVGKSSLVNAMLGTERVLVHEAPGTTRDAVDTPFVYEGRPYVLVDTAGIRRKGKVTEALEKLAVVMALKSLERSQVALLVMDASAGVTAQDTHIAGYAHEAGRAIVIVVNRSEEHTS